MTDDGHACPTCGFVWDDVDPAEVPDRLRTAVDGFVGLLRDQPGAASVRPSPTVWSALEYGSHVRDVLLLLRDRVVLAVAEDQPVPTGLHPDVRVDGGLYRLDTPDEVAEELRVAAGMFLRLLAALPPGAEAREMRYGWPVVAMRPVSWVAAQAVHEAEHHLDDARRGLG